MGTSFDQHVVGGYRFLMRFYCPGDDIFIFGFSRGAYIARFLSEMLDHIGLLSHGNEELVTFAWKAFSQWQCRRSGGGSAAAEKRSKEMYRFMKGFRETFSRPIKRIRFLGLFDTVNSVPRFEAAWMERSKFPYTARTSAKVIRHAVSIDERRAKFRQDLISQQGHQHHQHQHHRTAMEVLDDMGDKYRAHPARMSSEKARASEDAEVDRGRRPSAANTSAEGDWDDEAEEDLEPEPAPYRVHRSRSRSRRPARGTLRPPVQEPVATPAIAAAENSVTIASVACDDAASVTSEASHQSHSMPPHADESDDGHSDSDCYSSDEDETRQDISEVWFAGGHGDIGGGWDPATPEELAGKAKAASHVPLVWMVREAMKAGLTFDMDRVIEMGCAPDPDAEDGAHGACPVAPPAMTLLDVPDIQIAGPASSPDTSLVIQADPSNSNAESDARRLRQSQVKTKKGKRPVHKHNFHDLLRHASTSAPIHDSLMYGCGLSHTSTLSWRLMEYLPFRRMDLSPDDGSWRPVRWPLPRGEVRDMPWDAKVHGSVIRRLRAEEELIAAQAVNGTGQWGGNPSPDQGPPNNVHPSSNPNRRNTPRQVCMPSTGRNTSSTNVTRAPEVQMVGSPMKMGLIAACSGAYRPGNLLVPADGKRGGRGLRVAPKEWGLGEWVCVEGEGDPVDEVWVRRDWWETQQNSLQKGEDRQSPAVVQGEKSG